MDLGYMAKFPIALTASSPIFKKYVNIVTERAVVPTKTGQKVEMFITLPLFVDSWKEDHSAI